MDPTTASDVTRDWSSVKPSGPNAAEQLLPLVYDELRKLAAQKMSQECPGQTLQATALVHEAYVRLVDTDKARQWDGRGHFFAAAAEAMRRILVENARKKGRIRRGRGRKRIALEQADPADGQRPAEVLALDEALTKLEEKRPEVAALVKLRYYAGLTLEEAAAALHVSPATASRYWTYARSWLYREMSAAQ